jgi:ATP-dependent DNA ligase
MSKAYEVCLPTRGTNVPSGPDWIHEVKYDGYRVIIQREGKRVRLLARRPEGIFVAPFEQGEIGPDLFRAACEFGLEGLVSKRRDRPIAPGGRRIG